MDYSNWRAVTISVFVASSLVVAPICIGAAFAGVPSANLDAASQSRDVVAGTKPAAHPRAGSECCSDPGQISGCWWEDARDDKVACTASNENEVCRTGTCNFSKVDPVNENEGLCTCSTDDDCNVDCDGYSGADLTTRCGVCNVDSTTGLGVCGPSFCNGHRICSCWGGCEVVTPAKDDTSAIPPNYENYGEYCSDTAAGHAGYCCEGYYSSQPSGAEAGYCSSDTVCSGDPTICRANSDCDEYPGNPCAVGVCDVSTGDCSYIANVSSYCTPGTPITSASDCCCFEDGDCPSSAPCVDSAACVNDPSNPQIFKCSIDFATNGDSCEGEGDPALDPETDDSGCRTWQCENTATFPQVAMECLPRYSLEGESCADTDIDPSYVDDECTRWTCNDEDTDPATQLTCQNNIAVMEKLPCNVTDPSNTDSCAKMFCKVSGSSSVCTPGKDPGDTCVPPSGYDYCYANQCSAEAVAGDPTSKSCGSTVELFPSADLTVDAQLEDCTSYGNIGEASYIGDASGNPSASGDNTCADDNYSIFGGPATGNPRFVTCDVDDRADYVHWFGETVDGDIFQLKHSSIRVRQSASAGHPWNPAVAVKTDCDNLPESQYTCNDDCNFLGTNLSDVDCSTMDGFDSAVTSGPWPLHDDPYYAGTLNSDWDTNGIDDGFRTEAYRSTAVVVDSLASTPPYPAGGEYDIEVKYHDHFNNSCINTASYVAAPIIRGDQVWKERWRGTLEGHDNFICRTASLNPNVTDEAGGVANCLDDATNAALAPGCWAGDLDEVTTEEPGQAFYRVDLPEGRYKIYTDEAGMMWDASGWANRGTKSAHSGTPYEEADFGSVVMSFYGGGGASDGVCLGALDPNSNACYGGLEGRPRERIFDNDSSGWHGWLDVSNNFARPSATGIGTALDYELNIVKAPREFLGITSIYYGEDNGGGGCACSSPVGDWPLEGYRLDLIPNDTEVDGFSVVSSNVATSSNFWLFNPNSDTSSGRVIQRIEECEGSIGANTCIREMGPYPLPFQIPYSGDFYGYYCIDAAGRIDLRKSPSDSCTVYDNNPHSRKISSPYTNATQPGYSPTIYPLWGKIVPCWNSIRQSTVFGAVNTTSWKECKPGGEGRIVRQTGVFEGTTAEIITFDGFDGYLYPEAYRSERANSLQFQVILRIDGRITFFYKLPQDITAWDRILDWNGWTVGAAGTLSRDCGAQATGETSHDWCRAQYGEPGNQDIRCDNERQYAGGDEDYPVYEASDFCINRVDDDIVTGIAGP